MVKHHTNIFAILSLIFAFVFFPLGFIFGLIALSQIKKTREEGKGLAIAGIVISSLAIFGWFIILLTIVSFVGTVSEELTSIEEETGVLTDSIDGKKGAPQIPIRKVYENTGNGVTLTITGYTFEKKSDTYGKLKDIEFTLHNHQGSKTIFPNLLIFVVDQKNSKLSVQKEVELSEFLVDGKYIQKKVTVDLGIGGLENPKELKVVVKEWPDILVTVSFETDFVKGFS